MAIIALLTDFGTQDEYVGVMKGAILSVNPRATLIDITHQIPPQDIVGASFMLPSLCGYFPQETIYLVVVDPAVGSRRRILALRVGGGIFLAPDNGVLAPLIASEAVKELVAVTNSRYFHKHVSATFHGRDIFAPVAGHLSAGVALHQLGPSVAPHAIEALDLPRPQRVAPDDLRGTVVAADRFGNLISNIDRETLLRFLRNAEDRQPVFRLRERCVAGLAQTYDDVGPNRPLALIGSRGMLEVAVNCGNAREYFAAGRGDAVSVRLESRGQGCVEVESERSRTAGQAGEAALGSGGADANHSERRH